MFSNIDFGFNYKQLHETPPYVSAHKVFHKAKIKPRSPKVHEDSDPLVPKVEKENFSKNTSHRSKKQNLKQAATTLSSRPSGSSSGSGSGSGSGSWYEKWKLKDLSLFRSAFEGHGRRDNYVIIRKTHETLGSGVANWSKKDGISLHERHYINNRAAAEEMRRKTFLPYKKTLMGCADLDPGVREFCKGACS